MAKKVTGYIKLQIPAGKATPAPPVGPALGPVSYTHLDVYKRQGIESERHLDEESAADVDFHVVPGVENCLLTGAEHQEDRAPKAKKQDGQDERNEDVYKRQDMLADDWMFVE